MLAKLQSAEGRKYLYGLAGTVIAVLVGVYGVLTEDQAAVWLALVGAVLWAAGNLTAIRNTTSVGRAALYGVSLAVLAVLVKYQIIDNNEMTLWAGVLAAVFGVGSNAMAFVKVTPDVKADEVFPDGDPLDEGGILH